MKKNNNEQDLQKTWLIPNILSTEDKDFLPSDNWGVIDLKIPEIWSKFKTKGEGIKVAVLDTGIDVEHDEFINKINETDESQCKDFTGLNNINDTHGHGTNCAGIIGSSNTNHSISVAPESTLMIGRVLVEGDMIQASLISDGIDWAIKNHANIISLSLGSTSKIIQESINRAVSAGVIVVCGAGNSNNQQILYPARYTNTISVGAVDRKLNHVNFSPIGKELDIVAPGDGIYTTDISDTDYDYYSGTSMAAPFLAGVIALYLSSLKMKGRNLKEIDHEYLKKVFKATSDDLGKEGKDDVFGWGLINPMKFLQLHINIGNV